MQPAKLRVNAPHLCFNEKDPPRLSLRVWLTGKADIQNGMPVVEASTARHNGQLFWVDARHIEAYEDTNTLMTEDQILELLANFEKGFREKLTTLADADFDPDRAILPYVLGKALLTLEAEEFSGHSSHKEVVKALRQVV